MVRRIRTAQPLINMEARPAETRCPAGSRVPGNKPAARAAVVAEQELVAVLRAHPEAAAVTAAEAGVAARIALAAVICHVVTAAAAAAEMQWGAAPAAVTAVRARAAAAVVVHPVCVRAAAAAVAEGRET